MILVTMQYLGTVVALALASRPEACAPYDRGQLVTVRWPILVPPPAPGPQFAYHVEHRPQV